MRGDIVHRVYGVHEGREEDTFFGAYFTVEEAKAKITKLQLQEMHGGNWAEQYHNGGFVIKEAIVQTDFEIPARPKPRDRYFVRGTQKESNPGVWATTTVEVFRRAGIGNKPEKVLEYERNYGLLKTFEPFRQGGNEYALISPDYSATSVVDLATGLVVASEPTSSDAFCPVGFYVPDWWDLHDGSVIPGSEHWKDDCEWPTGQFGLYGAVFGVMIVRGKFNILTLRQLNLVCFAAKSALVMWNWQLAGIKVPASSSRDLCQSRAVNHLLLSS